jgi:hypothetical protein
MSSHVFRPVPVALPLSIRFDRPGEFCASIASAWSVARPAVLAFPPIFLLLLGLALFKHLDHDEHQFIASGALLAREGLLPYRDYPYFHVPNLAYVYALLDRVSPWLLLNARIFNCACSAATLSILFALTYRWYLSRSKTIAFAAASLLVAAVMTNPIVEFTTGKAWNHDLPVLLTLLSLLALWRWHASLATSALWAATAGLTFGLAVGTRLTFAPAGAAFMASFLLARALKRRQRVIAAVVFLLAAAIAMLPSWHLLFVAPRQFIFGNLLYPHLNTLFREEEHYPRSMTLAGKIAYCFTDILEQPGNVLLLVAFVATMSRILLVSGRPHRFELTSLLGVILCLLVASFVATPLWTPYFFAPIPFAALFIAGAASAGEGHSANITRWWRLLAAAAIITVAVGAGQYRFTFELWRPSRWYPVRIHRAGVAIASLCHRPGPVLTFAPILPLEGGRPIYPEFATGPFAARAASVIEEDEEETFDLFDEDDLKELADSHPPAAILTGLEGYLDDQLSRRAVARGMQPHVVKLPRGHTMTLWLPPQGDLLNSSASPNQLRSPATPRAPSPTPTTGSAESGGMPKTPRASPGP